MMDREEHSTHHRHGQSIAAQQASDRAFDVACMVGGHNLLGLEFQDKDDCGTLMQLNRMLCSLAKCLEASLL